MATPIAPSELLACVVQPEDDEGVAVVKAHVIFPVLFMAWYNYAFDDDMNFTTAFAADLCAITCGEVLGEEPLEIPTPNQWREVAGSISGDKCEKFRNSLNVGGLFYDWYSAVYNEDKTFTDDFKAQICSIVCPDPATDYVMTIPTPTEMLALVPGVGGDFCTKFNNAVIFGRKVAEFFAAVYTEDRKFTPEFKGQYCALNCTGGSVVIPPGGAGETLPAPTLSATTDLAGEIRWSWTASAGADTYILYEQVSVSGYTPFYTGPLTYHDDPIVAPGAFKVGAVVAVNSVTGERSPRSNAATGYRPS